MPLHGGLYGCLRIINGFGPGQIYRETPALAPKASEVIMVT